MNPVTRELSDGSEYSITKNDGEDVTLDITNALTLSQDELKQLIQDLRARVTPVNESSE